MTHSYRVHYFHLIWSTKKRVPFITKEIQIRLFPYLATIAKSNSGTILEVGGMADHIHILVELSNLDNFTSLVRDLKACSSLWIHKNFPELKEFSWQEGFGSFSVSFSILDSVRGYIRNQEQHHAIMSFDDEFEKILKLHKIKYDERFFLG